MLPIHCVALPCHTHHTALIAGDPSDHTPDKCGPLSPWNAPCTRALFNGLARVVVQAGLQAGTIVLTASGPGLRTASISIPVGQA